MTSGYRPGLEAVEAAFLSQTEQLTEFLDPGNIRSHH